MKKYIWWVLAGAGILFALFLIRLPRLVEGVAVRNLEEATGRRVESGRFRYNYLRNILYIEGFRIYEEDGERVFVSFDSFDVNMDIVYLLKRELYIKELTFVNPNLRLEYSEGRGNYESIIESIGQEKKEEAAGAPEEEDGFIRRVEVRDVTIESFTLHYEDVVIEAENEFTFITPNLLYERGSFNFSSEIDFLGKGIVDVEIEYTEDGGYRGKLQGKGLLLDDKLYITKRLFALEGVEGVVDTSIEAEGNIFEGLHRISGEIDGRDIRIESEEYGELLRLKEVQAAAEKISTGERIIDLSRVKAGRGTVDIIKALQYAKRFSDDDDDDDDESGEGYDVRLGTLEGEKLELITEWGEFSRTDIALKDFQSRGGREFLLDLSTVMDGDTEIEVSSQNTLEDSGKPWKERTVSKGTLRLAGSSLEFLKGLLPEERTYEFNSGKFAYETEYSYSYPEIDLKNTLSAESVGLTGLSEDYPEIGGERVETSHELTYWMDEGRYSVEGDIQVERLALGGGADSIRADNLSLVRGRIGGDTYKLGTLEASGIAADIGGYSISLDEVNLEEAGTTETGIGAGVVDLKGFAVAEGGDSLLARGEELSVRNLQAEEGSYTAESADLLRGEIRLENIAGEKREDTAGESDYPVADIGRLTIRDTLLTERRFRIRGDFTGTSVGNLRGDSDIDFSGIYNDAGRIKVSGRMNRSGDIRRASQTDSVSFRGEGSAESFDLAWLNIYTDDKYALRGRVNLSSKIDYRGGNLQSENFIYIEDGGAVAGESQVSLGSLTSENTLSLEDGRYGFSGRIEVHKAGAGMEGMNISLEEGDIEVESADPDDIYMKSLILIRPLVRIEAKKEGEAVRDNTVETEDVREAARSVEEAEKQAVSIDDLQVRHGRVEYRSSELRYNIRDIDIEVTDFTSRAGEEFQGEFSADLTGTGTLKGNFISSLERRGDFNPTSLNIEGGFEISNLDLLDFKEYLAQKLPNEIDSGKVFYEGTIDLHKGKFKGENLITVKTIYIGERTDVSSAVPLKLAVSVLKDRKGDLLLDVPVSGDFNDPKFRIYRVVLQAIRNILIKAATSPVNILTRAFNLGDEKVATLDYEYLAPSPAGSELKKLDTLVELLEEKQGVEIVLTLFTNRAEEKRVLNEKLREEKFFKRDTKDEELEAGVDKLMEERREFLENYFRKKLLERRVSVEVSDIPREKPVSSIDFIFDKD